MITPLIKRTALTLATAFFATAAYAEPTLRGDVTVTTPVVTVGDLFDNAGLAAETAIFRSPAPGTTGTVTIDAITNALRAAGIETFQTVGLTAIKVSRDGATVDRALVTDLITQDLRQRGILGSNMEMTIALDAPLPDLASADTLNPARLEMLRYMPGSSSFSARFAIAGLNAPLDISGQIELLIEAPHLTRTLPEGAIIGTNDIEMRMVPLAFAESSGILAVEQLVGMQLQRQTRSGVMLRPADINQPQIVSRNETVTMLYQQGALTLTATGKALNAASLSQPVSVLNTMTNRVLQGTATGNGTVTITSGPQQVAGL